MPPEPYLDRRNYDRFSDDRVDYLDTDDRPTVADLIRVSLATELDAHYPHTTASRHPFGLPASPPFGGDQGRASQDTGERLGPAQNLGGEGIASESRQEPSGCAKDSRIAPDAPSPLESSPALAGRSGTPHPITGVPLPAGVAASHRLLPDDAAAPQAAPNRREKGTVA